MKNTLLSVGIGTVFAIILCGILGIPIVNSIAAIACCAGGSVVAYYVIKLIGEKKK